jgi:F420H(2)-dependent quinone reductase
VNRPDSAPSGSGVNRRDRLLIWLESEGNKRLRRVGTIMYRLTRGRISPSTREVLLLTTRGRKTGKSHTVLLQGFRNGTDLYVVAANAGRRTNPDWFLNLQAAPGATVEIRGRTMRVHAQKIPDNEAATLWPDVVRRAPTYRRYVNASDRVIPLVRLTVVEPDNEE